MSGCRIRLLPRAAAGLALAWLLLLAGQQVALLHPLGHLGPLGRTVPAQAGAHGDAHLPEAAAPACDLCPACTAAGHLAAAAPVAAPARGEPGAAAAGPCRPDGLRRAVRHWHNRGPPTHA